MPGGVKANTPWGELACQLGGSEGYMKLRESDIERVAPGSETLRSLFGDRPALILLDELSIYLRKIQGRDEEHQMTPFLTSLFKAIESAPKAVLVFTLAIGREGIASDAYAKENELLAKQIEELTSVAGRKATTLDPTSENETAQVLRRRLFSFLANKLAKFLLKVPVSDYTMGFRIYSNKAANHVVNSCGKIGGGFIVLSETLVQLYINNFKIWDIKTKMVNRMTGKSSVNLKLVFESFLGLAILYLDNREKIKFAHKTNLIK